MAEIRDDLVLEIDQALRQIDRIETSLNNALAPIEVRFDPASANRQLADLADSANRALDDIDIGFDATEANRQLDNLARTADQALSDIDLDIDTSQVREFEATLREVELIAERAATETQSISLAAGKAETNFEDLARALGVSEDEARRLSTEILQSQAAANRLEDAARDVARQLGLSDDEAERLTRSLRQADVAADAIDVTAIRVANRFGDMRTAAAGVAGAFAAIGGAQLLTGALRGANTAIQSFARLEDSINAVNVVFGTASSSVLQFGEDAAASAGLSQEAFNQAVVPIGSLLQNFGFDAREAADAAVILVQRGADLASVYGGTVNDALLAVGAALRGEADPLERYGASVSAARVETFALAEGLARTKAELTPAILLQARYGLILSDTAAVQNDFANTADDLANAQRSAGAEVQNFVDDIGESLAPALETVLVLLPDMLEGLRQLVPGFVNAGDSAAAFFETLGQGGGFREEGAQARAFFDALTIGPGVATEAAHSIAGLVKDILNLDTQFTESSAAINRGATLLERAFTRSIGINMAKALDTGVDAVDAFDAAIRQTATGSQSLNVFTGNFRDLAIAANLTQLELRDATVSLIENADQIGLTAGEIDFLISQLVLLNSALFTDIEAVREFNRVTRELGEETFGTVTTRFATFAEGVEDGTDRAATALAEMSAAAERQYARTSAAFDLFAELPDKIKGSFIAAVDALREQVEARLDFDINIAILRALDLDALADEFLTQGLAAAGQLEQAVNDIPEAIEADQLLQGMTDLGQEAFDALVDKFVSLGLTPTDARRLAEELSTPEVIAAVEEAGVKVGTLGAIATRTSYQEELEAELRAMDADRFQAAIAPLVETGLHADDAAATAAGLTIDTYDEAVIANLAGKDPSQIHAEIRRLLTADTEPVGRAAAGGFAYGFQEELASREDDLRTSITNVLDGAIYRDSPPKLFLDAGRDSGEAFWSGFNQAELTLRTAPTSVGGSVVTSSGGTTSGDVNVNINLDNARLNDPVSDVARMAQIAGSVAHTYNQVRN